MGEAVESSRTMVEEGLWKRGDLGLLVVSIGVGRGWGHRRSCDLPRVSGACCMAFAATCGCAV